MFRIGSIGLLFVFLGKVRQLLFSKAWEINAVMERKDSNCIGILSDLGDAATTSNLGE